MLSKQYTPPSQVHEDKISENDKLCTSVSMLLLVPKIKLPTRRGTHISSMYGLEDLWTCKCCLVPKLIGQSPLFFSPSPQLPEAWGRRISFWRYKIQEGVFWVYNKNIPRYACLLIDVFFGWPSVFVRVDVSRCSWGNEDIFYYFTNQV